MVDRTQLISRIQKLLALSKSSNIHEAELAMQKVNDLMKEHQIAFSDLLTKEAKKSGVKDGKIHRESEVYRTFMWQIGKAAAILFDCDVLICNNGAFFFIGLPEDIVQAEYVFYYLRDAWKAINAADTKSWKLQLLHEPRQYEVKQYKAGHGQGFALAIQGRARDLAYERKRELKESNTGTALVVLKDQLLAERLKGVKMLREAKIQEYGFEEGHARGKAIPLGGAIERTDKQPIGELHDRRK